MSGLGCRMDRLFFGCLGYADDLLILSASRSGLQSMVKICEEFAKKKSLKFSTNIDPKKSKTKCVMFSKGKQPMVAPIMLNGDPLPWVREVKHLGNVLQSDNSMQTDCVLKRGRFIGKVNSLLKEFHFVDHATFVKLLTVYATSFYGSNRWDLYSVDVDRIYKSWNVTIRNVFNLPWSTHRYWIETVSDCPHPKTVLSGRYVKFVKSLTSSNKSAVRYLSALCHDDRRTLLGRTLYKIGSECGADHADLTTTLVRNSFLYFPVPDDQLELELLDARSDKMNNENFTSNQISEIIDNICTS